MKTKKGAFFIAAGLLLIAAALSLAVYNIWDEQRADKAAAAATSQLSRAITAARTAAPAEDAGAEDAVLNGADTADSPAAEPAPVPELPAYVLNPEMEMPIQTIDGWDYIGLVEIPAYELSLPVISDWSYSALKIAPCRYSGSVYKDDMIVAAHNYKSYFRTLQYLVAGDTVVFTDMDGNVFTYVVVEYEILEPTAVEEPESGDWDLTLFTCTRGAQNRIVIRCERAEESKPPAKPEA